MFLVAPAPLVLAAMSSCPVAPAVILAAAPLLCQHPAVLRLATFAFPQATPWVVRVLCHFLEVLELAVGM